MVKFAYNKLVWQIKWNVLWPSIFIEFTLFCVLWDIHHKLAILACILLSTENLGNEMECMYLIFVASRTRPSSSASDCISWNGIDNALSYLDVNCNSNAKSCAFTWKVLGISNFAYRPSLFVYIPMDFEGKLQWILTLILYIKKMKRTMKIICMYINKPSLLASEPY